MLPLPSTDGRKFRHLFNFSALVGCWINCALPPPAALASLVSSSQSAWKLKNKVQMLLLYYLLDLGTYGCMTM